MESSKGLPEGSWTPQERWAWEKIATGEVADFNEGLEYGGPLSPQDLEKWPESRVLSARFLETVLFHESCLSILKRQGIRIAGARFKDSIDFWNGTIKCALMLLQSVFDSEVDFGNVKTTNPISMVGSCFKQALIFNGLQAEKGLHLEGHAIFEKDVDFRGSNIEKYLDTRNATFMGEVNMIGARINAYVDMGETYFHKKVVLMGTRIGIHLNMASSKFKGEVLLNNAKIDGQLVLRNAKFAGPLSLNGLQVKTILAMDEGAEFDGNVNMTAARIGGQLRMTNATFKNSLDMNSLQVNNALFMDGKAEFFGTVSLVGAKIKGQLAMKSAQFKGDLNLNDLEVGQFLLMDDQAAFEGKVGLTSAKVGGLVMTGATFKEPVNMAGIRVASSILLNKAGVESELQVNLRFAEIGLNLDISNSRIRSLDLTNARIRGLFRLGAEQDKAVSWTGGAKLTLCSAEVGVLQYLPEAWPDNTDLIGFTYSGLSEFHVNNSKKEIERMRQWLGKQKPYSPQPYEQLAKVLTLNGHKYEADEILHASRVRAWLESSPFRLGWWWQLLICLLIGFGYRTYRLFFWLAVLVVMGTLVFISSEEGFKHTLMYGITYSLDMLLPLIRLDDQHYVIRLTGGAYYYFYFQKIMGYVLVTALAAGLSGLSKRQK